VKRVIAIASVATLAGAAPALAHHDSTLPSALERTPVIRRIYPDLFARELARTPTSWERLRRMGRTRWMHEHSCDPRTLTRRFKLYGMGVVGGSWALVERRWACEHVAAATRSFLRCIADHEGGRSWPDVWYGGSRGWQGGRFAGTDRVVNHFQTRPYWAQLVHPYATERTATWRTFSILTNPVNAADIAIRVGPHAYATKGLCS